MINKTLQSFTIQKELGAGGMATVYLAENNIGKKAAIKVLHTKYFHDAHVKQRFVQEAKVMAQLHHPSICSVISMEETSEFAAIIMEYLEGQDLSDYISKHGAIEEAKALDWLQQIVPALDYAHSCGMVHRDIKPSNFFLTKAGQIKVMDFGIAKAQDSLISTHTNSRMGSVAYMSPEQIKSPKYVTHKTDIYSLGVTLHHLLAGKIPYDTTTQSEYTVMEKIIKEPLPVLSCSDQLNQLIQVATQKDPKKRPESLANWLAYKDESNYKAPEKEKPQPNNDGTVFRPSQDTGKGKTPRPNQKTQPSPKPKPNKWLIPMAAVLGMVLLSIGFFVFKNNSKSQHITLELFERDGLYGYKAKDSLIIKPKYVDASTFIDDKAKVSDSKGIYYINLAGDSIEPISKEDQNQIDLDYSKSTAAYQNNEYKNCVLLLKRGAQKWHKLSQGSLGGRYLEGKGVTQNYDSAFYWHKKAALKNVASSQTSLGFMYALGKGVDKNIDIALEWYLKAANNGDAKAMFSASSLYLDGKTENGANYPEGIKWLKKAAETNALAQFSLGTLYLFGQYGLKKDETKAKFWLEKSCNNGNTNACNNLEEITKIDVDEKSVAQTNTKDNDSSSDEKRGEPYRGNLNKKRLDIAKNNKKTLTELEDLALSAFNNSNFTEARNLCLEIIKSRPNDIKALKCVGFSYTQQTNQIKALQYFERSAKLGDAESFFLISNILYAQQKYLQAKQAAKNACDLGHQGGCQNYKNIKLL